MSAYAVKPLDEATWPDVARLAERHHGVRGGCTAEGYPEDAAGRSVSGSFLHDGTLALFDPHGSWRACGSSARTAGLSPPKCSHVHGRVGDVAAPVEGRGPAVEVAFCSAACPTSGGARSPRPTSQPSGAPGRPN